MTGQALGPSAVAGRAGAAAAAMGASTQHADEPAPMQVDDDQPGQLVEPAAQKALPAALMVMFKKNSVVNLQDVRSACSCCLLSALSRVTNHAYSWTHCHGDQTRCSDFLSSFPVWYPFCFPGRK